MLFAKNHYTRDWRLLAGVCAEWTNLREVFNLGSKATREQIEKWWDAIFNVNPPARPHIRRLHHEMMRDEALVRHLLRCYWKELHPWERKGYHFEEVRSVVLTRLWLQVVRNACKWLKQERNLTHWALFWNTDNLTEELRRAINETERSEGSSGVQLPKDPNNEVPQRTHEPEKDYRGNGGEDDSKLLAEMLGCCRSDTERALVSDWFFKGGEYTEAEEEAIACLHHSTCEELNVLLRRIFQELARKHRR